MGSSISINEDAHHNALNVCSITLLCYRRINWFRKSRIDFDLGEETFEFETLNKIINEFIQQSHSISYQWITNDELDQKPELVRTLSVKPPRTNDKIRLVKIGDIDLQPCGELT